jgi:hypothetical protein
MTSAVLPVKDRLRDHRAVRIAVLDKCSVPVA